MNKYIDSKQLNYINKKIKKSFFQRESNDCSKQMLNDKLYRTIQSKVFQKQFQDQQKFNQLRQTLVINEIIKCGKEILGNIQSDITDAQTSSQKNLHGHYLNKSKNNYNHLNQNLTNDNKPNKYVYKYDTRLINQYAQQQPQLDEISFTLSNEENNSKHLKSLSNSKKNSQDFNAFQNQTHRKSFSNKYKNQSQLAHQIQHQMKYHNSYPFSLDRGHNIKSKQPGNQRQEINKNEIQNVLFNKKAQDKVIQKQYDLSSKKKVQTPLGTKQNTTLKKTFSSNNSNKQKQTSSIKSPSPNRKLIFTQNIQTTEKKSQSVYQSPSSLNKKISIKVRQYEDRQQQSSPQNKFQKRGTRHPSNDIIINLDLKLVTPQRKQKRNLHVPLSQQITKSVYGRLKQQVSIKNSIKQTESKQYKTTQESDLIWSRFIERSQKWIDQRKLNAIERQMVQRNSVTNNLNANQVNKTNNSFEIGQNSRSSIYNTHLYNNNDKNKNRLHQPYHTKNQFNQQIKSDKKQRKQSSVQNYINKLKVQTQLLKVKLLNPLKNQLNINQDSQHQSSNYKEFQKRNILHKQKSIKNLKNSEGFNHIKNVYGTIIGKPQ